MFAAIALVVFMVQVSWTHLPGPHSKASVELTAKLQAHVQNYTLEAANFVDALMKVAGDFKIPMGIEWARSPSVMEKVSLSRKSSTVQEIIGAIAQKQPAYRIEIKNAVVHVFPRDLVPGHQDFLDLRISEFQARDEVVEIAGRRLREIIKATVSPPRRVAGTTALGGMGFSGGVEVGDPTFSLQLQNVRARDVLDALSLASDRKIWVVTFTSDSAPTPTGFRRTLTLWNNNAISDNEQPVWDIFRWGQMLPGTVVQPTP